MSSKLRPLLVLAFGLFFVSACAGPNVPYQPQAATASDSGPAAAPAATVTLIHVSFSPSVVTVRSGRTVEWVWDDGGIPHNVTFPTFRSLTQTSGTYFHTFHRPGIYTYRCTIHGTMFGTVIVR